MGASNPNPRRAAIIDLQDDEAVLRQHLRSQVHRLRPAVVHHLRPGTAVDGDDDGGTTPTLTLPRTRGREILARSVDGGEELAPVAGSKRVELGRRQIN